ncbi:phage terminase large subunit [Rothia sp. AR01]|uniref:Phage terminase large subunit n=1 Tax=Rothia santali TaxID=2949643 RepID=A0A9X2HFX5_9MICC|nr:phage terminase large subunit [Rothia santali]MCP3426017.1 phage terminase large subunit [Rothia santali]
MNASFWGALAAHFAPHVAKWETPGDMARELDFRTVQTPALDLIDAALVEAFNTPDSRLIISMPPQEGKSQRASRRFPTWALQQNPDLRIAIASYEANIARRWGRAVRDDITQHSDVLDLAVRDDLSAQHEWQLVGRDGGIFTAGIGGAMTGRPVDLLLIDDPVKGREQADSPTFREKAWDWWTDTALTRLAPGAPVIVILTRWHEDDLAGRLMKSDPNWRFLRIPAEADHRPEKGETDPLGREPGQFMVSARGRTTRQWQARKRQSGPKTWASLYQGRPSPDAGGVFPGEWARYSTPMWTERPDGARIVPGVGQREDHELVQSWDLAFKATDSSDYVVGQVWLRVGTRAYLLDMIRDRLNFNDTLAAIRRLSARWPQAVAKYVEDKANGPAVMNALAGQLNGLIPVEPEGSKVARANAVSPLVFSHDVVLPDDELLPNVGELVEEAKLFPASSHDDSVDAMTQAVNQLLLHPLPVGGGTWDAPEWELMDARGWSISPY